MRAFVFFVPSWRIPPGDGMGGEGGRRGVLAALGLAGVLSAVALPAGAARLPLLPGIGAADRRVAVDLTQVPWNAIAKVQTNIGTRCTGALIAPRVVLTAAHCLYNPLTRALLEPISLHVLIGATRGTYRWHRTVARYTVGPGYSGPAGGLEVSDWARLELSDAIPGTVAPLRVVTEVPPPGTPIALPGYNQDHAQILMADVDCRVTRAVGPVAGSFITHDCDATRGTSGGPLLLRQGGSWVVIGINIAAGTGVNVALPAADFAH